MSRIVIYWLLAVGLVSPLLAEPRVSVAQAECLLVGENSVIKAQVEADVPGSIVRLYFRRLHEEVEDFYWVQMQSKGAGEYWGVLPKPADEVLHRRELRRLEEEVRERWALWWREKLVVDDRDPNDDLDQELIRERAALGRGEPRHWMDAMDDRALETFLSELEYEPTEYLAAVYDGFGERLSQSRTLVTRVKGECQTNLTPAEAGLAHNLTVGETAVWQHGKDVFHWLCDGIVSRVDANGVWRGDDLCRACIIGWQQKPDYLVPLAAGVSSPLTVGPPLGPPPPEVSESHPP